MTATAAQAYELARAAGAKADTALEGQQSLAEAVGMLARDSRATSGKVDEVLSEQRKLRANQTLTTKALQDLVLQLRAMRPRLDSVPALEEEMGELTATEHRRAKRRALYARWGKRLAVAAAVGAATTGGAVLLAFILEAFFGIHVPHIEVHP